MTDDVDHPAHYAEGWSNGAEVIDITENLNFNRGNAVKYIARAGRKDSSKELEDLRKAEFYLKREIVRVENAAMNVPEEDSFFVEHMSQPVQARVWTSLKDVPEGLLVYGADEVPGDFPWRGEGPEGSDAFDHNGPFTEVLEA